MKVFLLAFLMTTMAFAASADIELASNGKTDYIIVAPANPTSEESDAVKDLRWHLDTITGAKFRIGKAGKKNIFIGVKAPSDNKPLGRYERRIRNEKGNIYLYGNGRQGNTFAIYDFLEAYLGCQWYSFFGDMKIPKQKNVSFDEKKLHKDIIPSINHTSVYGSVYNNASVRGNAFRRRARFYDIRDPKGSAVTMLGANYPHMPSRIIPSGFVKYGEEKKVYGPLKYFKDKAYFKTNPEFFAVDWRGKRNWLYQLCFSNKELRRELIKNFQIIIDNEYKGGEAKIFADLNDTGRRGLPVCFCKECDKLNRKHGGTAGSYWDFCVELGNHFLKKYPDIRFYAPAYQSTRDLPVNMPKLPPNITLGVAALMETDMLKPYAPGNRAHDMIKEWSKIASGDFNIWGYPTVYPRPLFTRPLVANINRMVQNMRFCHALGANEFEMEFGVSPTGAVGFNELRMYLIARLSTNIDLDVPAAIEDFMIHYYGKDAAPIMLKYYYELEELEKNEKRFMRWWPDHRSCLTYLTPENLLRWQKDFDKMLAMTPANSRRHLNIRRARQNLDEATLSVWYKFAPGQMPDRDMIYKRHQHTARADIRDLLRTHSRKITNRYYNRLINNHIWRPIYYHYALSGPWKPLPEPFASMPADQILRTVPYVNRTPLVKDPEAVVGIAAAGNNPPAQLIFTAARWEKPDVEIRDVFPVKLKLEDIKAKKGYNFYHIGSTRLYSDINIYFNMIYAGGVALGYLYDEKNPEQVYDVYISIKYDAEKKEIMSDQVILVRKKDNVQELEKNKQLVVDDPGQFG